MNAVEQPEVTEVAKNVIPARLVRVSHESAHVGAPGAAAHPGQPRVEMIRDGQALRAIDVFCGCGQRIRLRCVFDAAS